jgi:hypothetical protein
MMKKKMMKMKKLNQQLNNIYKQQRQIMKNKTNQIKMIMKKLIKEKRKNLLYQNMIINI